MLACSHLYLLPGRQGMRVRSDGPQLISQMVQKYLNLDCSVLMGANIAGDIAREELSEAVVGYSNYEHAKLLKKVFETQYFVVNLLPDVVSKGGGALHRGYGRGCPAPVACCWACRHALHRALCMAFKLSVATAGVCFSLHHSMQSCMQHVCVSPGKAPCTAANSASAAASCGFDSSMTVTGVAVRHNHVLMVPCLLPGGCGDVRHPEKHRGAGGRHGGWAGSGAQQQSSHHAPGVFWWGPGNRLPVCALFQLCPSACGCMAPARSTMHAHAHLSSTWP
jgi:hypothetical protein